MIVLITGNRGFIGSATQKALEDRGDVVIGFDIADGFDLTDYLRFALTVARLPTKPDVILHEAAIARFADADANPKLAHAVNVTASQHVVTVAEQHHIPIVFASTGSVYMPVTQTPPITEDFPVAGNSIYGVTKLIAETYVRAARVPTIILRYAHLYGASKIGHGLIGGFRAAIEAGRHPQLLGGEQTNDFTYIDDVVAANLAAIDKIVGFDPSAVAGVYNIGTGVEISALDAGEQICFAFGYDGPIDVLPARSVDPARFVYDISKAERLLGFRAKVPFAQGLAHMKAKL